MLLRRLALLLAFASTGGGAWAASNGAANLLYERTLMADAGARCRLLDAATLQALRASRLQARGAALRAGGPPGEVEATEARARAKADGVDCRAAGLRTAAERVRQAFADYAQLSVMRFPGPASAWRAERPDPRLKGARWSLVEQLPGTGGWMLFGWVGGRPALLDARRGAAPAAFAQIGVRDPARLSEPYLRGPPPPSATRVFLAASRGPAAQTLLPAGARGGTLYTFSPDLAAALAGLDFSEQARARLAYPGQGREREVDAPIEIGDLAAAQAFVASGAPRPAR